ncbi:hypothetical protein J4427_00635 [Candidatus Woesearchaeota archaeon]|nr:hypothetical protein [Candidatus Woesearchaeota archaeon]
MIFEVLLLVLIILNLVLISITAFLGKKNILLMLAILEAILAIVFALVI